MSTKKHEEKRQQARQLLSCLWPKGFDFDSPRPLKIGITEDMLAYAKALGIPLQLSDVRTCLRIYTMRTRYQKSLVKGGDRFDLNGEPCGAVTPEQQEMAKQTLRNINQKYKTKQQAKAEQDARPKHYSTDPL